ncbi:hypothetical protein B0T11DRAFT_301873 [Plectosphaerella cucumerina]|uniref:Uncharacterized protein n=1 Tax=Plectosphaerella cucumerina TaxID=40658 RepID=A0A8K0WYR0_9PEZI|nr:hypothetical protein B0T11DRAFT_301873 [Plectosphaerella cucumerina]
MEKLALSLFARDALPFPPGDNDTDTAFGGTHFNLTLLNQFNYTLYSNGTISNGSWCFIAAEPWAAPTVILSNGTFLNSTGCDSPIDPIGLRGGIGVGFGVLYGICLVGVLINLAKHGKLHLPAEKHFAPVSRRWQWYWCIFTLVFAFISLFTNIDVDRFRIVGLPIILNSFCWYIMQMGALGIVWEATRHWGSWQERQFIDPDPFRLRDDDRRTKVEFYMPLVFYFWLWLNFFLIVPRNWGAIELQRSPEQTALRAAPSATDIRFKLAAFFLIFCWLVILASLLHSIKHYKFRPHGIISQVSGYIAAIPIRFWILLTLSLALIAYQILASFSWDNSVLNADGNLAAVYVGGYGPALLILFTQLGWGYTTQNEDLQLKRQRRQRGEAMDREMGIVSKPHWWSRTNTAAVVDHTKDRRKRQAANGVVDNWGNEGREPPAAVEMADMHGVAGARSSSQAGIIDASKQANVSTYGGKSDRRRTEVAMSSAGAVLFPNAVAQPSREARRQELMQDGPAPPPYTEREQSQRGRESGQTVGSVRSTSTGTGVSGRQPQQIRSMLDV